jgi:hypothetical protein
MLAKKGQLEGFPPATIKPERLVWADAYFGHSFLQTEPDFLQRFAAQIAACR